MPQINDLRRPWYPSWSWVSHFGIRFLETVLDQEVQIVTLVEHLALDVRMVFPEKSYLAVLLCHKLLAHRGDFDVDVILGQVEVGSEVLRRFSTPIPFDGEGMRFVLPVDSVEVEETCKLSFAVVRELCQFSR